MLCAVQFISLYLEALVKDDATLKVCILQYYGQSASCRFELSPVRRYDCLRVYHSTLFGLLAKGHEVFVVDLIALRHGVTSVGVGPLAWSNARRSRRRGDDVVSGLKL